MKLLITGGCGFLGSNLAVHALDRGDNLTIFDNLYREGSFENLQWLKKRGAFTFVNGDIRDQNAVTGLVQDHKPEAIFHMAGQVAMTTSVANPRLDFEVNAIGTFNLLEAVRLHCPEAFFLYASTNKIYGDLEQYSYRETETRFECVDRPSGFDETTPIDFQSPYGCSKGAADQYVLDYSRIYGMRTVVFRHSSMYGGRQFSTYDQGWVGWFCRKAAETKRGLLKEQFTISGTGKQVRDVLYADDAVALYFGSSENIDKVSGQAFNVGGGIQNSLSLLELLSTLERELDIRLDYIQLPPRERDQKVFVADTSKIRTCINWQPKLDKVNGIKRMLTWVLNDVLL
jgi:CDP-paratose 2-epimerase